MTVVANDCGWLYVTFVLAVDFLLVMVVVMKGETQQLRNYHRTFII